MISIQDRWGGGQLPDCEDNVPSSSSSFSDSKLEDDDSCVLAAICKGLLLTTISEPGPPELVFPVTRELS